MENMKFFALLLGFVVMTAIFSLNVSAELEVKKIDKGSVVISELNNPAVFDFVINNKGEEENAEIYSLITVSMVPKGKFVLAHGENTVEVKAYLDQTMKSRGGFFNFEYQIKGDDSGIFKDTMLLKIVSLKDVLEIEPRPLNPVNTEATVIVKNKENTNLENVKIELDSPFFSDSKEISLKPFEEVPIQIKINKDTKKIIAGPYIVSAKVNLQGEETKVEGLMDYLESSGISVDKSSKGAIIKDTTITKTNQGNTPATAAIEVDKDIISRLFTSYSLDPEKTERNGFIIKYTWTKDLSPAEVFTIDVKTNYTIPFIILVLIVIVGVMAKVYSQTAIVLTKRVSYVKTKGGQFALKVNLHVKAKKHVDNIQVIDRLPTMSKLYESFGKKPDRVDEATKRIFWNVDRLSAGEERVYTYIIYSELKVVGRFELPAATAVFEKEGKTQEAWSNKTYFAAEIDRRD